MPRLLFLPLVCWQLVALSADAQPPAKAAEPPKKLRPGVAAMLQRSPESFIRFFDKSKRGYLTREDLPEAQARVFDKLDLNHDGKLDAPEVEKMLETLRVRVGLPRENLPPEAEIDSFVQRILDEAGRKSAGKISRAETHGRLREQFAAFDLNKDGYLDKYELRQAAGKLLAPRVQATAVRVEDAPMPDFDALDQDADGRLTRDELRGTPYLAAFEAMDSNKDGKVSLKEFEAYFKKQAELKAAEKK